MPSSSRPSFIPVVGCLIHQHPEDGFPFTLALGLLLDPILKKTKTVIKSCTPKQPQHLRYATKITAIRMVIHIGRYHTQHVMLSAALDFCGFSLLIWIEWALHCSKQKSPFLLINALHQQTGNVCIVQAHDALLRFSEA